MDNDYNPFSKNQNIEPLYMNQPIQQSHSIRMQANSLYETHTPPKNTPPKHNTIHYDELVFNVENFSYEGTCKTSKVIDCENLNKETHILNLKDVFKYITLGGTLKQDDYNVLEHIIADTIYTNEGKNIEYIIIKKAHPISGTYNKKKIIKFSLFQYISICNTIFNWLQTNEHRVIYDSH